MIFKCNKYPCYRIVFKNGYIQFSKGEYRTEDKEEIQALESIKEVEKIQEEKLKKKATKE